MSRRDLTIAMVGAGGDGSSPWATSCRRPAARDGLNVIKTEAYGPQIRGGESSCVVRLSPDAIHEQGDAVDVLVVFSWADFARFQGEVLPAPDAVVLFDAADPVARTRDDRGLGANAHWLPVPFAKLAGDAGAKGSKNVVGLGVLAALLGLREETIRRAVEKRQEKLRSASRAQGVRGRPRPGATLATLKDRGITFTPDPRSSSCRATRLCSRRAPRGLPVLRRLPDHALDRDPAVRRGVAPEDGRHGAPDRGRARRDRRRHRRVLRGREVHDGHVRPRPLAHDGDARPRLDGRDSVRRRGRAARRPLHGPPDEERAVRPLPGPVRGPRRPAARRDRCIRRRGTASTRPSTPSTSPRSSRSRSSS